MGKGGKRMHTVALVDMALSKIESSQELKRVSKKMSRHEENLLILKKFLKVRKEKEDNNEGIFFSTSFPSRNDVNGVEKRVKQMAKTLAMVTLREWMFDWKDLESLAKCENKSHIYDALPDSVFKSLAKFLLSIFDTEDFERHNFFDKINAENKKFYRERLLDLEGDDNPIILIAEGKISFDGFPSLTEFDIGWLMQRYSADLAVIKNSDVAAEFMSFGLDEIEVSCFKKRCRKHHVEMARTVMLQYAPLKEEIKMHILIENIFGQCYCTLDALSWEALCDIGILDMKMHLASADLEDALEEVARRIELSVFGTSRCRCISFKDVSFIATYTLRYGPFGSFSYDVIDLIKIAEGRRRYEGHRYINKHHILWAVRLTEVKDFVGKLINGIGLQNFIEEPATYPPYNIYMAARSIANIFGDEFVCIEHLVAAIVFEMNQRKLNGKVDVYSPLVAHGSAWIEFESKKCVQAFFKALRRPKWKSGRYLVKIPTKIVPWPVPKRKVMDELRRLEKDMRYGWHEFADLRCDGI
ncbi:hypothetical protein REPUB_Repub06bG0020800 [Reevesia pubescens]